MTSPEDATHAVEVIELPIQRPRPSNWLANGSVPMLAVEFEGPITRNLGNLARASQFEAPKKFRCQALRTDHAGLETVYGTAG